MEKIYSFKPLINIGDTVFILKRKMTPQRIYDILETKIDDIRYSCAEHTIEYSTENSDHFEGLGWCEIVCFSDETYFDDFIEDIIFIRREDAERHLNNYIKECE